MKRLIFMGCLLALFVFCYSTMNEHYDVLARYQYVNDENRKIITEHLNADEINVLIDRQYLPEEFLPFIDLDGFDIRYVQWYNDALELKDINPKSLLPLVNLAVSQQVNYTSFLSYIEHYEPRDFEAYLNQESIYLKGLTLVLNPTSLDLQIDKKETLFRYVPATLVEVDDLPIVSESKSNDKIVLTEETSLALHEVCQAMTKESGKTCGNMIVTKGYVSFDEQVVEYEEAMLTVGNDEAHLQTDYPGQSLYQLGTIVKLVPASKDIKQKKPSVFNNNGYMNML